MKILDRFFKISHHKSSIHTELVAGITTFTAMAYIIFLQPTILSGGLGQIKTGLTAMVTGICFLLAMFFSPIVKTAAGFSPISTYRCDDEWSQEIDWNDISEALPCPALPAFLIILGIQFTNSIADGMMLGFIVYPFIKLLCGKGREIGFISYFLSILMILYLIYVRI